VEGETSFLMRREERLKAEERSKYTRLKSCPGEGDGQMGCPGQEMGGTEESMMEMIMQS